jgi:hypothetical protein
MSADPHELVSALEDPFGEAGAGWRQIRDFPGIRDPWRGFDLEDGKPVSVKPGTTVVIRWTLRTWVVCLDPPGPKLLGHFDWTQRVTVTVGHGPQDTKCTVDPGDATWDEADLDPSGYAKVAADVPNGSSYLPK